MLICCFSGTATLRQLQQINTGCPAGCAADGCVPDSTSGGYRCIRCKGSLLVSADDGTCVCPRGKYAGTDTCLDCDKGSWCPGGRYTAPGVPAQTSCGPQLTTIGKRSTSIWSCGELPAVLCLAQHVLACSCGTHACACSMQATFVLPMCPCVLCGTHALVPSVPVLQSTHLARTTS
jgi:hypothetical protein